LLKALKEKAELLNDLANQDNDATLTQESKTHLLESVYLHKDSIDWLQNDNAVFLKELKMQVPSADDNQELGLRGFQGDPAVSNPLADNKARFYALLLSKIENIHQQRLIAGFDRVWAESLGGDRGCASIENSLNWLQRIRGHIAYLRKVKSSVEARYSSVQAQTGAVSGAGPSVYGGSAVASSAQPLALHTDLTGGHRQALIQIETPGGLPGSAGQLALNVDP